MRRLGVLLSWIFSLAVVVLLAFVFSVAAQQPPLQEMQLANERGMLRLKGFFPTQPEQVGFDLAFRFVDGKWRLFGIGVDTVHAMPVASVPAQPQQSPGQPRPALLPASQPPAPAALQVPPPTRNPAGGGAPHFAR